MGHYFLVIPIKVTQCCQIKTVVLPLGKILKKAAQARIEGMTPYVNNFCSWQHSLDQPNEPEVQRMLIHYPRFAAMGYALLNALEIIFARCLGSAA
jgi:hypothetical protein